MAEGSLPARPSSARPRAPPCGEPRRCPGQETNAGAVAFSRTGDPNLGDFEDAVILKAYGEVPDEFAYG
jgi:hypothetical protein